MKEKVLCVLIVCSLLVGCGLSHPISSTVTQTESVVTPTAFDCNSSILPWDISWLPKDNNEVIQQIDKILSGTGLAGYGETILNASQEYQVNPAFALAMFRKEASFAAPSTRANKNNNPGNIITTGNCRGMPAGANCKGIYGEISTDGRFGVYPNMDSGILAYFDLLNSEYSIGSKRDCSDISCIIQAYCPSSECDTQKYSNQVSEWGKEFQCRIVDIFPVIPTPLSDSQTSQPTIDMTDPISVVKNFHGGLTKEGVKMNNLINESPKFWAEGIPECMSEPCPPCKEIMGDYCNLSPIEVIEEIQNHLISEPICRYSVGGESISIYTKDWSPLWVWPYGKTDFVVFIYFRENESKEYRLNSIGFLQFLDLSSIETIPCP